MPPPKLQSVTRRDFLAALAATSAAVGTFALSAREASAARQGAEASAHTAHTTGENAMLNEMTASSAQSTPTVVLVHGAFADSSSWNGVISRLFDKGYPVVAVANPLRGLKADAAYLAAVLKGIPGPIVLVGNS